MRALPYSFVHNRPQRHQFCAIDVEIAQSLQFRVNLDKDGQHGGYHITHARSCVQSQNNSLLNQRGTYSIWDALNRRRFLTTTEELYP